MARSLSALLVVLQTDVPPQQHGEPSACSGACLTTWRDAESTIRIEITAALVGLQRRGAVLDLDYLAQQVPIFDAGGRQRLRSPWSPGPSS